VSGAKIDMSALNINLSGYVTFNALSTAGSTTINGANITTGTLSGDRIYGGMITGSLLRTSNSSNYLTLQQQFIDFYNNAAHVGRIGYSIFNGETCSNLTLGNPDGSAAQGITLAYMPSKSTGAFIGYLDFSLCIARGLEYSGYATQSWVNSQGYITSSSLSSYATQSWVSQQLSSFQDSIMYWVDQHYVAK